MPDGAATLWRPMGPCSALVEPRRALRETPAARPHPFPGPPRDRVGAARYTCHLARGHVPGPYRPSTTLLCRAISVRRLQAVDLRGGARGEGAVAGLGDLGRAQTVERGGR